MKRQLTVAAGRNHGWGQGGTWPEDFLQRDLARLPLRIPFTRTCDVFSCQAASSNARATKLESVHRHRQGPAPSSSCPHCHRRGLRTRRSSPCTTFCSPFPSIHERFGFTDSKILMRSRSAHNKNSPRIYAHFSPKHNPSLLRPLLLSHPKRTRILIPLPAAILTHHTIAPPHLRENEPQRQTKARKSHKARCITTCTAASQRFWAAH